MPTIKYPHKNLRIKFPNTYELLPLHLNEWKHTYKIVGKNVLVSQPMTLAQAVEKYGADYTGPIAGSIWVKATPAQLEHHKLCHDEYVQRLNHLQRSRIQVQINEAESKLRVAKKDVERWTVALANRQKRREEIYAVVVPTTATKFNPAN